MDPFRKAKRQLQSHIENQRQSFRRNDESVISFDFTLSPFGLRSSRGLASARAAFGLANPFGFGLSPVISLPLSNFTIFGSYQG